MGKPPRVLVVEDEQDIAVLIKHTLERSGEDGGVAAAHNVHPGRPGITRDGRDESRATDNTEL